MVSVIILIVLRESNYGDTVNGIAQDTPLNYRYTWADHPWVGILM